MSSEKQTSDDAKRSKPLLGRREVVAIWAVILVAGWLLIIKQNQFSWRPFHISPAAIFLCIGWLGVLASAYFLWRSGITAASESDIDQEAYWRPVGRRHELLAEKQTLLKAIKEIEFDRELGKMSAADASSLTRVYRQRAIAVIKAIDELEQADEAQADDVRGKIERDLRARLELERAGDKPKKKKKKKKKPEEASS